MSHEHFQTFLEKKYDSYLTQKGIDTVCFMGYGYDFEEVKVGATFYFSFRYICRLSDYKRSVEKSSTELEMYEATLKNSLAWHNTYEGKIENLNDQFKLISKYKFIENKIWKTKDRREFITIKNLRTKEIFRMDSIFNDNFKTSFYLLNFVTINK